MVSRDKIKAGVIEFVDAIDRLSEDPLDKERIYLKHEVKEARHLLKYNEWFIAFENLTTNLHEIHYKMDPELIESAKELFLLADPSQSEETLWWLNELKK